MLFQSYATGAAHEPMPTKVKREPKHEEPQVRRLQIQSYSRTDMIPFSRLLSIFAVFSLLNKVFVNGNIMGNV